MSNNWNPNDPENPNTENGSAMAFGKPPVSGSIEMTVIRANGDVEELGVVSYYHRNPIKNWWINRKIKRRLKNAS